MQYLPDLIKGLHSILCQKLLSLVGVTLALHQNNKMAGKRPLLSPSVKTPTREGLHGNPRP